ncbi:MAG: TRAP transporter small permease subunit [Castellaniella sp.]|uniref:TRAP transporter small permease subunit n=1 Tax=Castellaniella sp. TaxID=1955812 RepID=UPI002A360E40|nr:TRAP transporter small permease subunit [Castellaniella sp.]MDY0310191.1 TRAP transporter small permease subunit [Castellaniella sp.]
MQPLLMISRWIDRLNTAIGRAVTWLVLVVAVVSAGNAVMRKLFNLGSNAWLELQWYLFGAIFLLAAGYTFLRNEHVRVDVLSQKLPERTQVWIEIFGVLFFLLPAACLVFWLSIPFFWESWVTHELSSNTEGLIRWPVKLLIPLGFALLILAGLSHLVKCVGFLRGLCPNPMRVSSGKSDEEALVEDILAQRQAQIEQSAQGR